MPSSEAGVAFSGIKGDGEASLSTGCKQGGGYVYGGIGQPAGCALSYSPQVRLSVGAVSLVPACSSDRFW